MDQLKKIGKMLSSGVKRKGCPAFCSVVYIFNNLHYLLNYIGNCKLNSDVQPLPLLFRVIRYLSIKRRKIKNKKSNVNVISSLLLELSSLKKI